MTRKSYNKSIIAIPPGGQYGKIFRSRTPYHPSLRSGRYGRSQMEYFPVLPSQSCNNIYLYLEGFLHIACLLLPEPMETLVIPCAYSDADIIYNKSIVTIPWVGQYGEIFHFLPRYITPTFGWADTIDVQRNIPPHCPPSHAINYICREFPLNTSYRRSLTSLAR